MRDSKFSINSVQKFVNDLKKKTSLVFRYLNCIVFNWKEKKVGVIEVIFKYFSIFSSTTHEFFGLNYAHFLEDIDI